ncbi:MAG TPA: Ig-like domain-containing protein, partial [Gemmatimonadaceae bacterium]|nr:Ig-like domain-containing protein [Gemmatimonadaceae bacterium]
MSGGTAGRRRVTSLRRASGAVVVALAQSACASQGAPPGGPPDAAPPKLVRIIPDTGAVNVKAPRAVFQFDEVVSERPSGGAPSLEAMFVVSPRQGEPDVSWGRDVITVKPRRGFRPNTVYTITMLPGISDLRGNVRKEGATAVFSTGPTIPSTTVRGVVFDWVKSEPAARALVEAIVVPPGADTSARARRDSTVYVTSSDSSGRFAFAHLPPGPYVVRGVLDANNNRALDPREAWDSVRVSLADSARVELLTFVHDTLGPRIASVSASDSVTLRVAFD